MANLFILTFNVLIFSLFNLTTMAELCNTKDKSVLLQIKTHFKHTTKSFSNWDPKTDCCNWDDINCSDDAHPGHVTLLSIAGDDDIVGNIPPAIGNLPFLTTLQMFSLPNLTGPIPPAISRLTNLQTLILTSNGLTGPVPGFLSRLRSLESLDLTSNKLTGSIPPSLSLLPKIKSLDLSFNKLTGSIPDSFGDFKTDLFFQVVNNRLSGPIPRSLGRVNLTTLDVSGNRFTGDASFLFGRDKPLESIVLRKNRFEFDFSHVDLPKGLKLMDIAENRIFGSLPQRLGQLPLNFIDVSFNRLCGSIPTGRRLKHFGPIRFEHNKCLCGLPLPPCK